MLLDKVISKIQSYQNFLLMIHEDPDGDTLAATIAIFLALRKIGKKTVMVCKDPVPKPFVFLPGASEIKPDILFGDYEVIMIVDCGDLKRTGFPERLKKFARISKNLINIDHHPKNDLWKIANLNLVDQNASSASEMVWEIFKKMKIAIDKDIATALLTGIYTDTGGFKHSNTTPKTLEIASELLNFGAKLKLIRQNVTLNKSVAAMRLWGIALSRIHKNQEFKIVSSVVTKKDLIQSKATLADLAGVVNLMNATPDSNAAILFYETEEGLIRASLRTEKENVDVSKIAKLFGGGGHKKAAGFTIDADLNMNGRGWEIMLK